MKMAKRCLAALCAFTMCFSVAACSGNSGDNASSGTAKGVKSLNSEQKKKIEELKKQLPDTKLEDKTVTWMAHYDINPSKGKVENPGLTLFKEKYGGTVAYKKTIFENRYNDLTKYVSTNSSPDFFPADDMDAFPKGAIKNMFDPIDDVVDLKSDIWKSTKSTCDAFVFDGKHYVAATGVAPRYVCIYNKKTIEENQLDDPAELYKNDKWTFNKFAKMCIEFTDKTKDKYGLDGYFYSMALNDTCGVPLISMKDGKIISNMEDPKVAAVQEKMYQLQKKDVCFPRANNSWNPRGSGQDGDGIGSNLTLFEPIGLYAIEKPAEEVKLFGDIKNGEVMFVPMPKFENDGKYYSSAKVNGYLMCHNAKNPKGFGALMNCMKITADSADDIFYDQLKKEYGWTKEMIDMRKEVYKVTEENPVFDFSYGVSNELRSTMELSVNNATMITGGNTKTWTAVVQEFKAYIDKIIKQNNEKM